MDLAYEIKAIMHDIDVASVEIGISLMVFIKALYPTYSHYLTSLQDSNQLNSLYFESLVEKIAECEKDFRKKTSHPIEETMFLAQKRKNQSHDSSRGEGSKRG
jgi:hypothetical protein